MEWETIKKYRPWILASFIVVTVTISIVIGHFLWEGLMVTIAAGVAWTKKLFTQGGLWSVLAKLPFILLAGSKKLIVKIVGSLLLYSARTRFRTVRHFLVALKLMLRKLIRTMKYHWQDMHWWERLLVMINAVLLAPAVAITLVTFALAPRTIRALLVVKLQESAGATMIHRAIPETVKEKAETVKTVAMEKIRDKLKKDDKDGDAETPPKDSG